MSPSPSQRSGLHVRSFEILLVDDSYGDTLLMRQALASLQTSTTVVIAEDGERALQMLRRQDQFASQSRPDIIFLDLNLPKLSGREVLAQIRGDSALKTIPVIVFSGSRATADIANSYALHANAYIAKPAQYQDLREVVAAIETFWFNTALLQERARGVA